NGRCNTSITHAYSIVIGSKHITLNPTRGDSLTASKQFRHGATSKSRSNTASNSTKHKSPHLSGWRQTISLITSFSENNTRHLVAVKLDQTMKPTYTLLPGVRGRTSIVTQSLTVYFSLTCPPTTEFYTLSLHDALPI